MSEKPLNSNALDPGRLHVHRRKRISCCTCFLYIATAVIALLIIRFCVAVIYGIIDHAQSPHKALYQNVTSLDEVKNWANVVRPLVDEGQRFDVAATVWVRDSVYSGEAEGWEREERAVFSDLVFRNMTLKSEVKYTSVQLQLPLSIFRQENLTNYDVRASFALIPHSPSLLDQAVNFSTWYPESITVPPIRPSPLPLGSASDGELSFEDDAINTFGISIPLIQFHGIHSKCPISSSDASEVADDAEPEEPEETDDLEDAKGDMKMKYTRAPDNTTSLRTTIGESPLKSHPYLITRTQLRVVDETRLYNRKNYNKAHKSLKSKSCGQGIPKVIPSYYLCNPLPTGRLFSDHGNFETRFELDMSSGGDGKNKSREWAYAPFLTTSRNAMGRKDFLPLPVNRENCASSYGEALDSGTQGEGPDSILVEWKLSFSSSTPAKNAFSDFLFSNTVFNHTDSEFAIQKKHDHDELISGIWGHKFREDAHPRRVMLLRIFAKMLSTARSLLDAHYWYTRSSSYSLSVLGYLLISLGNVIDETTTSLAKHNTFLSWLIGYILFWIMTPIPLLQLKAITRSELRWRSGGNSWLPTLSIAPASHRERASERADASLNWKIKAGILCASLMICHPLSPFMYYIISPVQKPAFPSDVEPFLHNPWVKHAKWLNSALTVTGIVYQRILNHRLRVFSGKYKISVWITVLLSVVALCEFVEAITGKRDSQLSDGLTVLDGVLYASVGVWVWQALTLPTAKQDEDDESMR